MRFGYFLSCEEYPPAQLLAQARLAEQAGFSGLWISDHYHPWSDEQGQSAFVWSMIGALSQVCSLPITTAVTCPTVRIHPAVVAQAAATSAVLTEGRFVLGVGTGEALNEHILGDRWPPADIRLEMLDEAIEVMRQLWAGGYVNHHGRYYTVENARIYTRPAEPPKVYLSGFGGHSTDLAARVGDGYITTKPDAELVQRFREGSGGKPVLGGMKACYAPTEEEAVGIAHRLWASSGLPGELGQVLPSPRHYEQASTLVTPEQVRQGIACGPDAKTQYEPIQQFQAAGFDEVYVAAVGPHYRQLIELYRTEILPG
ncbi:MAG TPA: TIGR03557 family F420-dependent LLM class oxidoreductase [Micromonosporaceae bacterium]